MRPIAVVTGAASGIGLAAARTLLSEGWTVVALDISEKQLAAAQDALSENQNCLVPLVCDVTSASAVRAVFEGLASRYSKINALICCAGVLRASLLEDMSVEEFDLVFSTNTRGPWLCARSAIPLLRSAAAAGEVARIVMLSSIAGLLPKIASGAYAGSKAALSQLTRVLAVECAASGILVNAIAPGTVDTPMIQAVTTKAVTDLVPSYRPSGTSPLGRVAVTEDITGVISFLLSDAARYITGTTIPVDGGTIAARVPTVAAGEL